MKLSSRSSDGTLHVKPHGAIDETALRTLTAFRIPANTRRIVFDLSDLEWINTRGAADWISFLDGLPAGLPYEFERCALCFVDYTLAIRRFTGTGSVRSLMIPFECDACRRSGSMLVEPADLKRPGFRVVCERCNGEAVPSVPIEDLAQGFGGNPQQKTP